jgi:hypothetical protein
MRHFFMGGDYWGERLRSPHFQLGQGLTNAQVIQVLKAAVDKQAAMRGRNAALPPEFQLDQERDVLPVDQAIDDQSKWITQFNDDGGTGWFWDQPADKALVNAAMTVQSLVNALDARERAQEQKAGAGSTTKPAQPPLPPSVPTVRSKKDQVAGTILAVTAVAAFATAIFISDESWESVPWSKKKPYSA